MFDATSWVVIAPEMFLLFMACAITLLDLWVSSTRRAPSYWATQITLLVLALWNASHALALSRRSSCTICAGASGWKQVQLSL